MTNFLADELHDLMEDVPTLKMPVAVLLFIVFIIPIMLFAGLILLVDWILQWTLEGLANSVSLIITSGLMVVCQYFFLQRLTSDIMMALIWLMGFALMLLRLIFVDLKWLNKRRAH